MNTVDIQTILDEFQNARLTSEQAALKLKNLSFEDIGYARVDHGRAARQGFPEVIFGQGKTSEQICGIFEKILARSPNVLITRTNADVYGDIRNIYADAEWHESAKLIRVMRDKQDLGIGEITVCTAGTSDIPVAEEAALTAEAMGNRVQRIWDAGVAGIHRILGERERLQNSRVIIVVAGMEGALPSVVGGLVSVPVIGVPTSIGYGASFGGVAALLGMLNSCASNVTVVNIDNGFGAAFSASLINRKTS
ncbi:MAG: nickel pincer cofactor biosynthesis protein LarB [Pyrinomonadaceae bacterium]